LGRGRRKTGEKGKGNSRGGKRSKREKNASRNRSKSGSNGRRGGGGVKGLSCKGFAGKVTKKAAIDKRGGYPGSSSQKVEKRSPSIRKGKNRSEKACRKRRKDPTLKKREKKKSEVEVSTKRYGNLCQKMSREKAEGQNSPEPPERKGTFVKVEKKISFRGPPSSTKKRSPPGGARGNEKSCGNEIIC